MGRIKQRRKAVVAWWEIDEWTAFVRGRSCPTEERR